MGSPSIEPDVSPESEAGASGFNPLQVLARRWPFLVAGVVLGAVVGALIYTTSPPQYESSAQVLVVKKRTELVKQGDIRVEMVEDYVATQVTLIKSEKIRLGAARQAQEAGLSPTLPRDERTLAAVIGGGLTVSRDKDSGGAAVNSGVLNLTFRAANSEDCRLLLMAVVRAHQHELYTIYDKASKEKIDQIDRVLDTVKRERQKTGEDRLVALEELREVTTEEVPSIRTRVSAQREQLRALEADRINLDDQLILIAKTGKSVEDRQLTLAQLMAQYRPLGAGGAAPPSDPGPAGELKSLEARRAELSRAGLGRDHPRLLAIDAQIAAVRLDMERPVLKGSAPVTRDELDAYTKWLEQKVKTNKRLLDRVKEQLEDDEDVLKQANGLQDRAEALLAQLHQLDAEVKRLDAEKLTTQATQGAGGYTAEPITPPADGRKIAPVLTRSLMTGLAIGLALGALMMFLAEMSDKSFRSPAEIRLRLGLSVIGHVPLVRTRLPADEGVPPELDPVLAAALRPKSSEAEAIRGLRTQLFFSTQGLGHRVIQVTSPSPGDGKSTLAANLAISLAQSGKRTVLIDCDFRKPRIHKLFGVAITDNGLSGVIVGTGSLADELTPSGLENLDLLLCGPRPANPAELLTSPQFLHALAELRERYDFVLVDTPPVLAVSDPAIVAPRVDGVLLVFRMTKKTRPAAERAREQLAGVGAKILGVIVNAADRKSSGYGYGYGYKYTDYQYTEDYADDKVAW